MSQVGGNGALARYARTGSYSEDYAGLVAGVAGKRQTVNEAFTSLIAHSSVLAGVH